MATKKTILGQNCKQQVDFPIHASWTHLPTNIRNEVGTKDRQGIWLLIFIQMGTLHSTPWHSSNEGRILSQFQRHACPTNSNVHCFVGLVQNHFFANKICQIRHYRHMWVTRTESPRKHAKSHKLRTTSVISFPSLAWGFHGWLLSSKPTFPLNFPPKPSKRTIKLWISCEKKDI